MRTKYWIYYVSCPWFKPFRNLINSLSRGNVAVIYKVDIFSASNELVVRWIPPNHNNDDIMSAIASQITSLTVVYSIVYSDADQRNHQSSASLAFVRGIHRWPVNYPHKWPVTRKMFPLDDVIMTCTDDKCLTAPSHYVWGAVEYRISVRNSSQTQISRNLVCP